MNKTKSEVGISTVLSTAELERRRLKGRLIELAAQMATARNMPAPDDWHGWGSRTPQKLWRSARDECNKAEDQCCERAHGILHATLYDQENAPSFSGSPGDYASIEKAVTLLNDISKEPALPVFDADNPRFRQVFDEAVHAHNLPSTRKGDGYRSPITQWCFELAYSVVNGLRLYEK